MLTCKQCFPLTSTGTSAHAKNISQKHGNELVKVYFQKNFRKTEKIFEAEEYFFFFFFDKNVTSDKFATLIRRSLDVFKRVLPNF